MDRGTVGTGARRDRSTQETHTVVDLRGGTPLLLDAAIYSRVASPYERVLKPVLDRLGAIVLLLVTLPVMIGCAVAIRLDSRGPVILRQPRVGRHGQVFVLYKFRTMIPDRRVDDVPFDGNDRRRSHKTADDPRITRVGRVLRRLSLDELPQFWNVLLGNMSLVGPRPELPEIVARYEPWQHARHAVKPGLTGRWQVSERGDRMLHEATDIDLEYIDRVSLVEDLRIMLWTPVVMFGVRSGF